MLRNASGHRRGGPLPKGRVGPGEVVLHVVKADSVSQVFDLLGEAVSEAGEPSHPHPHGEILSLDVAGGDLGMVGFASDDPHVDAGAHSGAVPLLVVAPARTSLSRGTFGVILAQPILDRSAHSATPNGALIVKATEGRPHGGFGIV